MRIEMFAWTYSYWWCNQIVDLFLSTIDSHSMMLHIVVSVSCLISGKVHSKSSIGRWILFMIVANEMFVRLLYLSETISSFVSTVFSVVKLHPMSCAMDSSAVHINNNDLFDKMKLNFPHISLMFIYFSESISIHPKWLNFLAVPVRFHGRVDSLNSVWNPQKSWERREVGPDSPLIFIHLSSRLQLQSIYYEISYETSFYCWTWKRGDERSPCR